MNCGQEALGGGAGFTKEIGGEGCVGVGGSVAVPWGVGVVPPGVGLGPGVGVAEPVGHPSGGAGMMSP